MSEADVPPERLEHWHMEWRAVGAARIAELLAVIATGDSAHRQYYDPLIHDVVCGHLKGQMAQRWLDKQDQERAREIERAEADRNWAWWHSWINTGIALLGLVVATIALCQGK